MTPQAEKVLSALAERGDDVGDDSYFPFRPIAEHTGFDIPTTRRLVRYLARKGFAEYAKGLWRDDGSPGGAGYRITEGGRKALAQ